MLKTMSKFLSVLVLVMALSTVYSFGQELDLKKDVILKDKVPYAKLSGKMSMFKPADLAVTSLNGDSLMTIKAWLHPSKNPQFDFLDGYAIRFVASGKVVIKPCEPVLAGKEQLLNFIFNGRDYTSSKWEDLFKQTLIVDNKIDPAAEAAFIEKFDNAANIQWVKEYEAKEKEILSGLFPMKKQNVRLTFEAAGTQSTPTGSIETINVYQGNLIAIITKESKPSGIAKYVYTFNWAVPKFSVGGKEVSTIVIATATMDSFPKIFVNAEGKSHSLDIKDIAGAERQLTEYLIENGRL